MKRTYRYIDGKFVEVTRGQPSKLHYVQGDYPDYESPVDGRIVHGKKGRRYDLARTGSRPYEGRDAEQREMNRQNDYHEQRNDRRLDESIQKSLAQLHPAKRRILGHG